jgi:hypothetical protein
MRVPCLYLTQNAERSMYNDPQALIPLKNEEWKPVDMVRLITETRKLVEMFPDGLESQQPKTKGDEPTEAKANGDKVYHDSQ